MIELTPAQARALAELTEREGTVLLHQIAHADPHTANEDVYATPHGTKKGYRITREGRISEIGDTLPSPG